MQTERMIQTMAIQSDWNPGLIGEKLAKRRAEVTEQLATENVTPRQIQKQVIILKTQNSPQLVGRFLSHILPSVKRTSAKAKIEIGILDDSTPRVSETDYKKVMERYQEAGIDIHYFRINEQDSTSFLGRLRNRALERLDQKGATRNEKQRMLLGFQILMSEQMRLPKHPDHDPDNRSDGYIAAHYSTVGKGHQSTDNLGSLLGAYMLGKDNIPLENGIVTHNDDDIMYATLSSPQGLPEFELHDYLAEREILFSDPQTEFTAGKYVGVSGSPIRAMATALEVATGILAMDTGFISQNAPSPYYIFDKETASFKPLTVGEAVEALPKIIDSFLARTPITGFKTSETFTQWNLTPHNFRFDQGNYSMIGTLERRIPSPTAGIIEFVQTGVLKTLFRKKDIERAFRIEEPILHVREPRTLGGDAFGSEMMGGAVNSYVTSQLALTHLYANADDRMIALAQDAYGDHGLTPSLLLANTPNIKEMRNKDLESINIKRKALEFKLRTLSNKDGGNGTLSISVARLIDACSEDKLDAIEKLWDSENVSAKHRKSTEKNTRRFLEAAKYWSFFFDIAYEIGQEDAKGVAETQS